MGKNSAPEPAPGTLDLTACPEWGKGGSYTLDPATGVRRLVERTEPAPLLDGARTQPDPAQQEA